MVGRALCPTAPNKGCAVTRILLQWRSTFVAEISLLPPVQLMPYTFPKSQEFFARAKHSIAGGVNSGIRLLEQPVPLYFERGEGARVWDVDGNEYIDFQLGQGALLYGHAPAGLADAIAAQAKLGLHWAAQCELELDVAERLQKMVPSAELVRFSNSATEAVMAAFRLARTQTGRKLILKFEGHYHGWSDEGLVGFANPPSTWNDPESPGHAHPSKGIIEEVKDQFVVARWNDIEHLRRRVEQFKGQIAAIVCEPAMCNTCCIEPEEGMLATIRELCDQEGMLMIADETITGFRFGAAGAQGYYNVRPDLTVLGKAIGGGTPFAALTGTREAMAKIISGESMHAGTLNANPLCLAASRWCLDEVLAQGPELPAKLNQLGQKLMVGLRKLADDHGVPLRPQGPGLAFHSLMLKPGKEERPVRNYRDYAELQDVARWTHLRRCLLEEGVRAIERGLWSISLAHTEQDIADALKLAEVAFKRHAESWTDA